MPELPNPWIPEVVSNKRFVLDEQAFIEAIEPWPKFLNDPSPEYLKATELKPILEILAPYMEKSNG